MKISFNWLRELCRPQARRHRRQRRRAAVAGRAGGRVDRAPRARSHRRRRRRGARQAAAPGGRHAVDRAPARRAAPKRRSSAARPMFRPPGGKVAWAQPGATLPGGKKLDRREIRGVMSPGMICSEIELGIGEEGDGILILSPDTPVGADLARHVGLLDEVLEVNVTPNRPDALSHAGIAREVAALFETRWRLPPVDEVAQIALPQGRGVDVEIRDPAACPRYAARVITGLKVGPSPLPMRVRLAACGVRAISNLVDVTNYVMLETGHPLHAFDLDRLRGGIVQVRRANRGEKMKTLDGVERPLQEGDVVIADGQGADRAGGRDGRRRERGLRDDDGGAAGDGDLRSARRAPHRQAARPAQRGVAPVRARRRRRRGAARQPAGRRHAGPPRRRRAGGRGDRPLPAAAAPAPGHAVAGRPHAGWRASRFRSRRRPRSWRRSASPARPTAPTRSPPPCRPSAPTSRSKRISSRRSCASSATIARRRGLPRGSGAPAPSPEALADRARDALAAIGLTEIVSWGFVPRPWLAALGGGARRRHRAEESDLRRLRGDADVAAPRARRRRPPQPRPQRRRRRPVRGRPDRPARGRSQGGARRADRRPRPSWSGAAPAGSSPTSRSTSSTPSRSPRELLRVLGVEAPTFVPRAGTPTPTRRRCFTPASRPRSGSAAPTDTCIGRSARSTRGSGASSGSTPRAFYLEVALDAIAGERRPGPQRGRRRASRPRRAISRSGSTPA